MTGWRTNPAHPGGDCCATRLNTIQRRHSQPSAISPSWARAIACAAILRHVGRQREHLVARPPNSRDAARGEPRRAGRRWCAPPGQTAGSAQSGRSQKNSSRRIVVVGRRRGRRLLRDEAKPPIPAARRATRCRVRRQQSDMLGDSECQGPVHSEPALAVKVSYRVNRRAPAPCRWALRVQHDRHARFGRGRLRRRVPMPTRHASQIGRRRRCTPTRAGMPRRRRGRGGGDGGDGGGDGSCGASTWKLATSAWKTPPRRRRAAARILPGQRDERGRRVVGVVERHVLARPKRRSPRGEPSAPCSPGAGRRRDGRSPAAARWWARRRSWRRGGRRRPPARRSPPPTSRRGAGRRCAARRRRRRGRPKSAAGPARSSHRERAACAQRGPAHWRGGRASPSRRRARCGGKSARRP